MKLKYAVAGAGALTLALAGPALATGKATNVAVGGSTAAGSHPITAASTTALTFAAEKTDGTFLTMNCSSANVPASPASTVSSGTGLVTIAKINKVNFVSCTGPGGTLTVTTSGSWLVHRTGGTITSAQTDTLPGHIEKITANVGNLVCKFTVTGQAKGSVSEKAQTLKVAETATTAKGLVVSNITGCGGQLKSGGKAKFSGTFKITSPDGAINAVP